MNVMKRFVYLYIGGKPPEDAAEGKKLMAAWEAWFGTLGKNLVDMGAILGDRKTLGGTAATKVTGYTVVQAADLKAAAALAKNCPLRPGESLEILEAMPPQM